MGILDERLTFGYPTSIIAATGTNNVGDVVDITVPRDIGGGHTMFLLVQVTTDVDSAADGATVAFQLVSDSTSTPDEGGTQTVHALTGSYAQATLVAGFQVALALPPMMDGEYEQYLGVQAVIGVEAVTAGAINAMLTYDPPTNWQPQPDAEN